MNIHTQADINVIAYISQKSNLMCVVKNNIGYQMKFEKIYHRIFGGVFNSKNNKWYTSFFDVVVTFIPNSQIQQ